MPILLGGLHQMANITAPGLNPSRAKHMIKDLKICADWYKINFNLIDTSLKNNQYNERSYCSRKRRFLKIILKNFLKLHG